jgi:hypothetical protein
MAGDEAAAREKLAAAAAQHDPHLCDDCNRQVRPPRPMPCSPYIDARKFDKAEQAAYDVLARFPACMTATCTGAQSCTARRKIKPRFGRTLVETSGVVRRTLFETERTIIETGARSCTSDARSVRLIAIRTCHGAKVAVFRALYGLHTRCMNGLFVSPSGSETLPGWYTDLPGGWKRMMSITPPRAHQKRWSTGVKLAMISATGFLMVFGRLRPLRDDRRETGRLSGGSTQPHRTLTLTSAR